MRPALVLALLGLVAAPLAGCFEPAGNGWASKATQIDGLRADGHTGRGIRVAILDTGLDVHHPSLRHLTDGDPFDGELVGYADFVGQSGPPRDKAGHGTFVAGVLAARPPHGVGSVTSSGSSVIGLAPDIDLLVGRVCATGHCSLASILPALLWAIAQDVDVISLSLGYTQAELEGRGFVVERFRQALAEAEAKGILVVAAAGNDGVVLFPASEPTVLAVGATDRDGAAWRASRQWAERSKPDLVAPGESIVGPDAGGGRVTRDGTSAAVPFVVAAAALAMAAAGDPDDAREVAALRQALLDTAKPLPGQRVPHDPTSGHGLLQAEGAAAQYAMRLALPEPPMRGPRGGSQGP